MPQWGFFFNQDRCVGCKTCIIACKNWNEERRGDAKINPYDSDDYIVQENVVESGSSYVGSAGSNNYGLYRQYYMKEEWRRVSPIEEGATTVNSDGTFEVNTERRYISVSCNHCADAVCVKACPQGNIYKDPDTGATLAGTSCISCGRCKSACPWGAPQFYDENYAKYSLSDPKRPMMTKCNLCVDRINKGLKTACVAACWNRALDAGPIDELRTKYLNKGYSLKTSLYPEFTDLSTDPNILFKEKSIK